MSIRNYRRPNHEMDRRFGNMTGRFAIVITHFGIVIGGFGILRNRLRSTEIAHHNRPKYALCTLTNRRPDSASVLLVVLCGDGSNMQRHFFYTLD
jgi:hypothetical protein